MIKCRIILSGTTMSGDHTIENENGLTSNKNIYLIQEGEFTVIINDDYYSFNNINETWIGLDVNWGDGSSQTITDIYTVNHNYASIDNYTITY